MLASEQMLSRFQWKLLPAEEYFRKGRSCYTVYVLLTTVCNNAAIYFELQIISSYWQ